MGEIFAIIELFVAWIFVAFVLSLVMLMTDIKKVFRVTANVIMFVWLVVDILSLIGMLPDFGTNAIGYSLSIIGAYYGIRISAFLTKKILEKLDWE